MQYKSSKKRIKYNLHTMQDFIKVLIICGIVSLILASVLFGIYLYRKASNFTPINHKFYLSASRFFAVVAGAIFVILTMFY